MRWKLLGVGLLLLSVVGGVLAGRAVLGRSASGVLVSSIPLHTFVGSTTFDPRTGRLYVLTRASGGFGYFTGNVTVSYYYTTGPYTGGPGGGSLGFAAGPRPYDAGSSISVVATRAAAPTITLAVGATLRAIAVDAPQGLAYVTAGPMELRVLQANTGALLRSLQLRQAPRAVAVDASTNRALVVERDGTVQVLQAATGTTLRTLHLPALAGYSTLAWTATAEGVYLTDGSTLSILNARDGTLRTTVPLPTDLAQPAFFARSRTAIAAGGGRVFVLEDGVLFTLDSRSGRVVRHVTVGQGADGLAFDAARGHLLLVRAGSTIAGTGSTDQQGTLQVLDARTGSVLQTLPAGLRPTAVFIDASAGHALVVDSGGRQQVHDPLSWLPTGIRQILPFSTSSPPARVVPASILVLDLQRL